MRNVTDIMIVAFRFCFWGIVIAMAIRDVMLKDKEKNEEAKDNF